MGKIVLNAVIREDEMGKEACNRLRRSGLVPAIVYKKGHKAVAIKVDEKELFRVLNTSAGENAIITLKISDGKAVKDKTVIVKESQHNPIKDNVVHVDFHEISLKERIVVCIPVETKGEPEGVKNDGGVLDHVLKELEVECLPTDIPEKIDVSVEVMKIGDSLRVKDLSVPETVKVLTDAEQTVVSVMAPKSEEEAEEGAAEEAITEPEVIREKKPAAGGEGAASEAEKKEE
ncbi:MAG: 50S ribosomal protein L25/general stress protein Ctc [Candidatus Omnitrophota bacterium]